MKTVELYARVRRAVLVEGRSRRAVAREFGLARKTVSKMLEFSAPPGYQRQKPVQRPKLGPWQGVIDAILQDDKQRPRKQRHTAKRIFERLRAEHGYTGGYTIVKDYVRSSKIGGQEMFIPLAHTPGEAQADFGEALVVIAGVEHPDDALDAAALQLAQSLRLAERESSLDSLRGIEGDAASSYFAVFNQLIVAQQEEFVFHERSRRPPMDNVNALLSFLYVLLAHDVASALETVGLDPAVGFLHRDRPGRSGLALDLMEELRPVLADRLVLSLINRKQVAASGFARSETGGVLMNDATRKDVLVAWQKRKQEEIQHPFLGERIPLGLIPYAQALLMARHLRGDLDAYPAFFWR